MQPKGNGIVQSNQRVLVVNGLRETTDVLKTVLEPRGFAVSRIRDDQFHGHQKAQRPDLVVLHEDETLHDDFTSQNGSCKKSQRETIWKDIPQIVIRATEQREPQKTPTNNEQQQATTVHIVSSNRERYLQKPFQYSELVQAIEQLLSNSDSEQ